MTRRTALAILGVALLAFSLVGLHLLQKPQVPAPGPTRTEPLTNHEQQVAGEIFQAPRRKLTLSGIPPSDPKINFRIRTSEDWKNPFLVVGPAHISVIGKGDVKIEDLEEFLVGLSTSAWPFGRVVAVQELGIRFNNDDLLIRNNLEKVMEVLKRLDVKANLWPSA